MELTGSIHKPLLMALLDPGGQRSRSQQAVDVAKASMSTLVEVYLLIALKHQCHACNDPTVL